MSRGILDDLLQSPPVIFGAGPQGRIVLAILRAQHIAVRGFLDDDPDSVGSQVDAEPVLGGSDWVRSNAQSSIHAFVSIGANQARLKVSILLREHGFNLFNVIHPSAVILGEVKMGNGNLVCPGAVIMRGTEIGNDSVINTRVSVDHDSTIEDGAYLSPGVCTAGCVRVGARAFIGSGAILGPNVSVGAGAVVGAGSLVLKDIPKGVLAYGSPARIIRCL